jgi:hypothetical protein
MSVFWESPILGCPFRGGIFRCQMTAENSALFCLKMFFSKIGKTAGLSKLNFQFCPKMCAILRISTRTAFCTILCDGHFYSFCRKFRTSVEKVLFSRFPNRRSKTYLPFLEDSTFAHF